MPDGRPWRGPADLHGDAGPTPEFPEGADSPPDVSRRTLLRLLGGSAALAGASGCSRGPREYIVPYVDQPPEVTPSVPSRYATTMEIDGRAVGLVVESHEGRPTKAEGNPLHPASLGALGVFEQASVLDLYDPARLRDITHDGVPVTWDEFAQAIAAPAGAAGKRIHVLLRPTSSPTVARLVERARLRGDVVVWFDSPVSKRNAWEGARLAFGHVVEPRWDFARADVVVSLDADFLSAAGMPMSWARRWADRRRLNDPMDAMSRLYVVEPRLTVTGMAADHRLRVQAREVQAVAADLLAVLGGGARAPGARADWVAAVARDLQVRPGASLVVAGDSQPPEVHLLAHAINDRLGNVGHTVVYGRSPIFEAGEDSHGLDGLLRALDAGEVGALVVVGCDPAYTAEGDRETIRRLASAPVRAYVGPRPNRTATLCSWVAAELHFLETWGDAAAFDGTPSIAQPLIRPLVEATSAAQVVAALAGWADATPRELVEATWRERTPPGTDFEALWRQSLVRGVAPTGPVPPRDVRLDAGAVARVVAIPPAPRAALEIVYFADAKVHDGRFADNPWLQELADPVTKLTWDNAALVGPATAAKLKLGAQDVVEIDVRGRAARAPVLVVPSMADDVVAVALGYGQDLPDRVSTGAGFDAYELRDSRAPWFDEATLRKVHGSWELALTQEHWTMAGRPIVLRRTLDEYRKDPSFAAPLDETPETLYELAPDAEHQWGMTVDLNACTGCSACVIACNAENNIPVVGKGGVRLSREMHWIRIDRYFVGEEHDAAVVVQPMLCQQCEKAPCEYVCPVNATVHSHDGLNEMIYNRCVGTRFCSNNCPYKVRRFNFFNYNAGKPESYRLAMNPDVTVRARGVMEKCTYCVQRIREVEIRARREERPIRDLEILTACQQTCPTCAIVFGDIADPKTAVSRTRKNRRLYQVLHDLGVLPRTRYLARIVNPDPEIAST